MGAKPKKWVRLLLYSASIKTTNHRSTVWKELAEKKLSKTVLYVLYSFIFTLTFLSCISIWPSCCRLQSVAMRMGTSSWQILSWIPTQSACWWSASLRYNRKVEDGNFRWILCYRTDSSLDSQSFHGFVWNFALWNLPCEHIVTDVFPWTAELAPSSVARPWLCTKRVDWTDYRYNNV